MLGVAHPPLTGRQASPAAAAAAAAASALCPPTATLPIAAACYAAGQMGAAKAAVKWAADYLAACHTPAAAGRPPQFVGLIGDPGAQACWPAVLCCAVLSCPVHAAGPRAAVQTSTSALLAAGCCPPCFIPLLPPTAPPDVDHSYWGRPEEQPPPRKAYVWTQAMPASDLLGMVSWAGLLLLVGWRRAQPAL